jgi:hypothetical protein
MYHAMAEPQRIREVLLYSAGIILSIDALVMIIGYYYFAQTTLAPGKKLFFSFLFCFSSLISFFPF